MRPDQIVDYLALVGDSVDNIPGVEKCGPKTAAKWLVEYGSLDAIVANADKVGGKIGENLRAALPQLPLSRQLATIKTDVRSRSNRPNCNCASRTRRCCASCISATNSSAALRELDAPRWRPDDAPAPAESQADDTTDGGSDRGRSSVLDASSPASRADLPRATTNSC